MYQYYIIKELPTLSKISVNLDFTMSSLPKLVNPICQPPIWLFDLGSKSFFFGFLDQSTNRTVEPNSIPIIFAVPRPMVPVHSDHHTSRKKQSSRRHQQLSLKTISKFPAGPSNLATYISRYESWEQIAMGEITNRGIKPMTRTLSEWEAHWRRIGGG
jgi:hypothetical protein